MREDPRNLKGIFYECCCDLAVEIQMGSKRMDIRERVAALAMLRQYLSSWDDTDESDRGTAVRKYEGLFAKKAPGGASGAPDPGSAADDNGAGVGDAGNGADERAAYDIPNRGGAGS